MEYLGLVLVKKGSTQNASSILTTLLRTDLGRGVIDAIQIKETTNISCNQPAQDLQTLESKTWNQNQEEKMTGIETIIAKELVMFAAKAIWDLVNSDDNDLKAEQAKAHSKSVMAGLSEEAQLTFRHHLPAEFKL